MDTVLLGITVVSLIVSLVMSVTAWRLMRDDKRRSAARIAALSTDSSDDGLNQFPESPMVEHAVEPSVVRAPWKPATPAKPSMPEPTPEPAAMHASGFLGASSGEHDSGGRQRSLAVAAVALFGTLSGGMAWMMSGPEGTSAIAVGPNSPLELVSLSHARQKQRLAVSGLVRNPVSGKPVERLSAVVFLFDRVGTFVTSSRAHVDFLKLGAGDESPFVVSIDAPPTVARYRVSFRTEDGVVPHIDRRGASPTPAEGEQPVSVTLK
jgi:hypothetical protein